MASLSDIKKVVARDEEGVVIPIFQKNGEPYVGLDGEQSTFTVLGSESKAYKAGKHAHMRKLTKRARGHRGSVTEDPVQLERDSRELVANAVIGFSGWDDGKEDLPFTRENVMMHLEVDHIFEQVNVGVQSHEDFFSPDSGS